MTIVPAPVPTPGADAAPMPPMPMVMWRLANGLAGAHMETISRGLGEAIGVKRGVLVISVAPGVPAAESGLVDGDVILKADGRDIASVDDLRRALAESADRAVTLDVARRGKTRRVVLKW